MMAAILFMFIIFPCHWAVYMFKIVFLQKPLSHLPPNFTLILLLKCDWEFVQIITLHWLSYHIFFFKIKNCLNDDLFISCDDRIGKMLHNIYISAMAMSHRWATRGPRGPLVHAIYELNQEVIYIKPICHTCMNIVWLLAFIRDRKSRFRYFIRARFRASKPDLSTRTHQPPALVGSYLFVHTSRTDAVRPTTFCFQGRIQDVFWRGSIKLP